MIEVRGVKIYPSVVRTLRLASIGGSTVTLPTGLPRFALDDAAAVLRELGGAKDSAMMGHRFEDETIPLELLRATEE